MAYQLSMDKSLSIKTLSDTGLSERKTEEGLAEEPNENELNTLRNDPLKLATIRLRLSDIAW